MDNIRVFLWLTLLGMAWLTYTAWVADYGQRPSAPTSQGTALTPAEPPGGGLPPLNDGANPTQPTPAPPAEPAATGELIRVRTDVLDVLIASQGGDLVRADLSEYSVTKDVPEPVVRLLDNAPMDRWVFATGLRSAVGGAEPNHLATFRSASNDYSLAPGQDELVVTLDWVGEGPLSARKTYVFRRGQYAVDLTLTVAPTGGSWRGAPYVQMERVHRPVERSIWRVDTLSFTGPVLYDGESFERQDFDDLAAQPFSQSVSGGWFAAIQHHFLAAAVPPSGDRYAYTASTRGQAFVLSAVGPVADVSAAMPLDVTFKLFIGPKLQDQLQGVGGDLERTVDYGITTPLAQPLFWLLATVESWVQNWGLAIIIVTILIKLVFYKLTAMSGRSMAKLRKIGPRMKALQERYKDDRQALSQAMMELYKKEKVNPAAGCLPILIQMPFFFAFYWVLVESVEMRHAPFALWLQDLSARDPFFVLPALMGAAMFFQTRMSPAPPDPMQARMMQIMPLVFAAFLVLFPAGLVLYQLTNTTLSILQQWRINTIVARESAAS
ncbi:MAG TPA: membrane protein insertase YidC [Gammaproteobacteria bacterium]|nr:membrane protein insertase YidC [Gammaproteobacteria bacterium]